MTNLKHYKRRYRFFNRCFKHRFVIVTTVIALISLFWDLISKILTDGVTKTIIPKVISVFSIKNTGAAWSILSSHTWFLTVISIIFIIVMAIFYYFYKDKSYLFCTAMGLIFGGAFGNLYDRLFFNAVRDFIKLDFINFPIFNLADTFIVIGVLLFCVEIVIVQSKKEVEKRKIKKASASVYSILRDDDLSGDVQAETKQSNLNKQEGQPMNNPNADQPIDVLNQQAEFTEENLTNNQNQIIVEQQPSQYNDSGKFATLKQNSEQNEGESGE